MNWNLGIISPTTAISNTLLIWQVATLAAYVIQPTNPTPLPTVNWNLGIISPTAFMRNAAVFFPVVANAPFVVEPSNPTPDPSINWNVNLDQPTNRAWLWGRRPVTGLQFPRGVYNY